MEGDKKKREREGKRSGGREGDSIDKIGVLCTNRFSKSLSIIEADTNNQIPIF